MIAGYTPGRTATISTTVYQLWRTNDDAGALFWVMINLAISAVVLLAVRATTRRGADNCSVRTTALIGLVDGDVGSAGLSVVRI